ncbi:transcription elongation factor SPT6 homolog isoform X2 [Cynara cardunculus var. scolymus]|uniref:transcription elongation factor SPT6 homolog isoform X2 n=1 Tax=Cynara cardunculus var. scolymus TaxID=59895 RepID=UPI000D62FC35|nr:transcription elongation factor SPT6 homolog isoform X2 [Cynara cardunculus var. scolymus]
MAGKTVLSDEEDEIEVEEDEREEPDGDAVDPEDRDEEDEEDEEGEDEYEKDGFIVDDVDEDEQDAEEEDRADSDEERQRKKKRKKRESEKNYVLDEDDYELLQDNNITGFRRPKVESKKFKRLKKARADADEGQSGFSDEEEYNRSGKGGRSAEEKLKRSLFGDDEGPPIEDIAEEDQPEEEEDGDIGEEEDEMADFIVDEEEVDEHGEPTRRRKVNKKKSRQAPGVSSSAMQEAHDIFGDVDELLRQRKLGLEKINRFDETGEWRERKLEDEFEPIILSEKYMTEKDDHIREIDIPERMQISEESTGPPPTDDMSIDEQSNWILNQLGTSMAPLFGKGGTRTTEEGHELAILKDDVMRFLEFMHVQKLDVPFIAMYRKEECRSLFKDPESQADKNQSNSDQKPKLRWHKVLWAILELDRKWLLLQKRKSALQSYYNKRFEEERNVYDETRLHLNQKLFDSITKSLKVAESEREIDDVDSKFNLHFPPGEHNVDEGQFKRPKRKSQYSICSKAGLWEVASKFGYSSEEFGLLISLEQMRMDELEDAKETPEEVASTFTCAMFVNPQAVLRGARHMAAVEISCEPCVRRHVRSIFMDNAVVSTSPTSDGNVAIDSLHQFAGIKWLKDKPLTRFEDAQWLLIQKAEEEKLIQVSVKLPVSVHDKLISDAHDYYLSDGVSKSAQLWNEQRKLIIKDAFDGLLLPSMAKEARALLTSRAKNWLLMEYGRLLWGKVSVAPYQKKDHDVNSSDDYEAAPRVMACCWGPGKPATTFVMLDSYGEVLDVLYAGSLSIRGQSVADQQRKKNDQQRVVKFMTDHQPHVVVLGAVNLSCARLKEDIYEIIFKMVEDNPRDVGHEMDGLSIVYADESLPHLYENSRISSDQLQPQPGIVKRAVALGRYLQNPLAMVATLCGPSKEILSWKLSPLESFLTADEKYGMVEQIMVDATNQVGLDVNLAISHEWLFAPLQFISGLGPRKAASLQRSLVRASSIYTRKDLLNHGLGKKVFVNAVGFLRVRRSGNAASSSQFIDLLDDTRIHPESYGLAQELAKDIYSADNQDDVNDDDDMLEMAIEHVRENPNLLKSLEVNAYAKSKKRENKKDTLHHTRLELIQGFQDWRTKYAEPSLDEEFYMISGETEDTLSEGRIVQATVRRVQPQRAICNLESGLTGMLSKEDYSDDRRDNDLTERLNEGDILTCKIKSIQKNRHQVFLSCRENDLRSDRSQNYRAMDPYYHEDRDNSENDKEKARKAKELAKKHFKPRMIVHPRFQNITADEAMEMLSDKEPGESIVRPSSRGPSYLTLTLKIYDGVYAHKDIIEGGKENKDITSMLRLGKTLKIGEDVFEDLDEVMDRYVDPLVGHLKTMLAYRKFRDGVKAEVDESLRKEKSENPSRIVYSFGISHEHPGTLILTYIRSSNPHHEYIGLYPKGFKFRKKMFEEIDRLVAYFQRHIDDPHDAGPSIRSVAAMVPMRSPATGGSGGWGGSNSNESGWRGSSGDRERTSTPSSRSGRSDYRNGGGHDAHPSGVPRPYGSGGGRGRGRGGRGYHNRGNEGGSKEGEDGWGSFPGAKTQNSPGREAFPGGWVDGGSKRSSVQSQAGGSGGGGAGWSTGW